MPARPARPAGGGGGRPGGSPDDADRHRRDRRRQRLVRAPGAERERQDDVAGLLERARRAAGRRPPDRAARRAAPRARPAAPHRPPARRARSSSRRPSSAAAGTSRRSGSASSRSSAMVRAPAPARCLTIRAISPRLHGQRPISRRLRSSIGTSTIASEGGPAGRSSKRTSRSWPSRLWTTAEPAGRQIGEAGDDGREQRRPERRQPGEPSQLADQGRLVLAMKSFLRAAPQVWTACGGAPAGTVVPSPGSSTTSPGQGRIGAAHGDPAGERHECGGLRLGFGDPLGAADRSDRGARLQVERRVGDEQLDQHPDDAPRHLEQHVARRPLGRVLEPAEAEVGRRRRASAPSRPPCRGAAWRRPRCGCDRPRRHWPRPPAAAPGSRARW